MKAGRMIGGILVCVTLAFFAACRKGSSPDAAPASTEAPKDGAAGTYSGNTIKYTDDGKRIITV
ncbi:MAG: hypothetical protein LBP93_02620, partial [Treponema sp.]|nr:hypothetical protein [Treponema sp.]